MAKNNSRKRREWRRKRAEERNYFRELAKTLLKRADYDWRKVRKNPVWVEPGNRLFANMARPN